MIINCVKLWLWNRICKLRTANCEHIIIVINAHCSLLIINEMSKIVLVIFVSVIFMINFVTSSTECRGLFFFQLLKNFITKHLRKLNEFQTQNLIKRNEWMHSASNLFDFICIILLIFSFLSLHRFYCEFEF